MPRLWLLVVLSLTAGCSQPLQSATFPIEALAALRPLLANELSQMRYPTLHVFADARPLPAGTIVAVPEPGSGQPRVIETLASSAWLFFGDTAPGALFEHPVVFALVDASGANARTYDLDWWPVVDGADRWMTLAQREAPGALLLQRGGLAPPAGGSGGAALAPTATSGGAASGTVPAYCRPEDTQRWALLVGTADDIAIDPSMTNNLALELKKHGYQTQQMVPAALAGGFASVTREAQSIRAQMLATPDGGYCDDFLFVWTGHGANDGSATIHAPGQQTKWVTHAEIAELVDTTTEGIEGIQVRVVFDTCYSGPILPVLEARMPRDPQATEPMRIVRDVFAMTSAGNELALGSSPFFDGFTENILECVRSQGNANMTTAFGCADGQTWFSTPDSRAWWALGS